jgi:hypothetical protein
MFDDTKIAIGLFNKTISNIEGMKDNTPETLLALTLIKGICNTIEYFLVDMDNKYVLAKDYNVLLEACEKFIEDFGSNLITIANYHYYVVSKLTYREAFTVEHSNTLTDTILASPFGVIETLENDLDAIRFYYEEAKEIEEEAENDTDGGTI